MADADEDEVANATSSPPESHTPTAHVLDFDLNLVARKNFFTLYLGTGIIALFLLIAFLCYVMQRSHSLVIQLAKPDTDAHVHEYIVLIKTSMVCGASVTPGARVAVQLLGTFCNSKRYTLTKQVMAHEILQRSQIDIFVLYTHMDIGEVQAIRCTLFNFSQEQKASWVPDFIEVMKSTTRERWAVSVDSGILCRYVHAKDFHFIKGFRRRDGLGKLILQHHMMLSPFFMGHRIGAYTSLTAVIYFFFAQSVMMMVTLICMILGHKFLGRLSRANFISHVFLDLLPPFFLTAMSVAVILQQLEAFLKNIRPSPSQGFRKTWRGLWRNDYMPDLMHCDVDYNWDRPPDQFKHLAHHFSSQTSLSSGSYTDESEGSADFDQYDDEEGEEDHLEFPDEDEWEVEKAPETTTSAPRVASEAEVHKKSPRKKAGIKMLSYCTNKVQNAYAGRTGTVDAPSQLPKLESSIEMLFLDDEGADAVEGIELNYLKAPLPGVFCQFCLWVKHLSIRGETLHSYMVSLSHQIRRGVQALSISTDTEASSHVMCMCLQQWTSSLVARMLHEAVLKIKKEQLDDGGLQDVYDSVMELKGNLWFSQTGHREGLMASKKKGDNAHVISSIFFSIMRNVVTYWKKQNKAQHRGILRRPDREICPPLKTKKLKFETKVHKKSVPRVSMLVATMGNEDDKNQSADAPGTARGESSTGRRMTTPPPRSSTATSSRGDRVLGRQVRDEAEEDEGGADLNQSSRDRPPITVHNQGLVLLRDSSGSDYGHLSARPRYGPMAQEDGLASAAEGTTASSRLRQSDPGVDESSDISVPSSPSVGRDTLEASIVDPSVFPSEAESKTSQKEGKPRSTRSRSDAALRTARASFQAVQCRRIDAGSREGQPANIRRVRRATTRGQDKARAPAMDFTDEESVNQNASRNQSQNAQHAANPHYSTSASKLADLAVRRMSTHALSAYRKKIRRSTLGGCVQPQTITKLHAALESHAKVVQIRVKSLIDMHDFYCCSKPLCQTYCVMYAIFQQHAFHIVHHMVSHDFLHRYVHAQESANITRMSKKVSEGVASVLLARARWMEEKGQPQNEKVLARLKKEQKLPSSSENPQSSSYTFPSQTNIHTSKSSGVQLERSSDSATDKPGEPESKKDKTPRRPHRRSRQEGRKDELGGRHFSAHRFGKRASHHGLIDDWSRVSYPFTPIVMPPVKINWNQGQSMIEVNAAQDEDGSPKPGVGMQSSSFESSVMLKKIHKTVKKLLKQSLKEVAREASWVLGLKESLASVVAFARMDMMEEVQDPLKIAIRNFTRALLVLLFEELLPKDDEENFVVSPDDIRQRRKRVSSNRTPGLFDLTETNNPGYDLDMLDFVVVKLCERWELAKLELQYQPTLQFLTRCLTFENLDNDLMTRLDDLFVTYPRGVPGVVLNSMTHVQETQHALAVMVNEVMAMTLVYVVPETLKAMKDVEGRFRNEEERVNYVCEKVSILENQVRHKLSRRVLQAAAEDVQDQLVVFARREEKVKKKSEEMISKLRELVKMDYYYTQLAKDELHPIKKELRELRNELATIHTVMSFQEARSVCKYAKNTDKLQRVKVREALSSLTEDRTQDTEYTLRQLLEVEWMMNGELDKTFPALCMRVTMFFMFLVTMMNMLMVTILGANFDAHSIGEWFELHMLVLCGWMLICEPIKCIWFIDFGWEHPKADAPKAD